MKVICIDAGNVNERSILKEGEMYTVIGDAPWAPVPCYELQEHRDEGYEKYRFIPVSSIDETEMIREYKKELTPERLLAHQRRWYSKRLKEENRIEVRSFLRAELHRLKKLNLD